MLPGILLCVISLQLPKRQVQKDVRRLFLGKNLLHLFTLMNNTNSSTSMEIQFYSITIHRWIKVDSNGRRQEIVYQEEEDQLQEAFTVCLKEEEFMSNDKFQEIIVSKFNSYWPMISYFECQEVDVKYFSSSDSKEKTVRASAVILLYLDHVRDKAPAISSSSSSSILLAET